MVTNVRGRMKKILNEAEKSSGGIEDCERGSFQIAFNQEYSIQSHKHPRQPGHDDKATQYYIFKKFKNLGRIKCLAVSPIGIDPQNKG